MVVTFRAPNMQSQYPQKKNVLTNGLLEALCCQRWKWPNRRMSKKKNKRRKWKRSAAAFKVPLKSRGRESSGSAPAMFQNLKQDAIPLVLSPWRVKIQKLRIRARQIPTYASWLRCLFPGGQVAEQTGPFKLDCSKPPDRWWEETTLCRLGEYRCALRKREKKKSLQCAILLLLHTFHVTNNLLMTADTGSPSLLILLDLTAAFHTMDHNILLHHLHSTIWLTDTALTFFLIVPYRQDWDFCLKTDQSTPIESPLVSLKGQCLALLSSTSTWFPLACHKQAWNFIPLLCWWHIVCI